MNRRTVLATAGIAAFAGCLSEFEGDPSESEADDGDDDRTPVPSTFEATLSFPEYILSVDSRPAESARESDRTDGTDLDEPAATAVETAIEDGEYETDEADDSLLEGLFGLQYVDHEGTVYDIAYTMPEYVLSGHDVPESEVDHDRTIASGDDTIRAIGPDNRETASAVTTVLASERDGEASDREYRAPVLDDHLAEFLEEYEYVAYPGDGQNGPEPEGYVELELDYRDPGPPYTITATELTDEQRYGRTVVDIETYPEPTAEALRAAADRQPLRTDERPDGIDDVLDTDAYVRIDGDVYAVDLTTVDHDETPVALEITDVDPDDRSFTLELSADSEPAVLFGGAPAPFGLLGAYPVVDGEIDTSDGRKILWSDSYDKSDHVHVGERDSGLEIGVNDIGITTELDPDDPKRETYELRERWGFEAGHYRLEDGLSIEQGSDREETSGFDTEPYPFVVSLAVPEFGSDSS